MSLARVQVATPLEDAARAEAVKAANDSMAYWQKPVLTLVPKTAPVANPTAALEQMYSYFD